MDDDVLTGDAGDFYSNVRATLADDLGITSQTSDDELAAIAEAEEAEALAQGQRVLGVYAYLRELRDRLS